MNSISILIIGILSLLTFSPYAYAVHIHGRSGHGHYGESSRSHGHVHGGHFRTGHQGYIRPIGGGGGIHSGRGLEMLGRGHEHGHYTGGMGFNQGHVRPRFSEGFQLRGMRGLPHIHSSNGHHE